MDRGRDTGAGGELAIARRERMAKIIAQLMPFLGLIAIVAIFGIITGGKALSVRNVKIILLQSCIFLTASMGATFTISGGNMDLCLGGAMVLACMLGGIVGETSAWLVAPVCILTCVACEMFVAGLHVAFNIPTFVTSFVMMFLGKGIASTIAVNRATNISLPRGLDVLDNNNFFYIVALAVFAVAFLLSEYTKLGKYNRAIGANPEAAKVSGVPVSRYKLFAFLFSGITLGIASLLMFVRSYSITAKTATGFETNIIVVLVVGGISLAGGGNVRVIKALIGCLIIAFLDNALIMVGISSTAVGLIKGVVFLTAVIIGFDRRSMHIIT